jgi:MFS family permease
MYLSLISFNRKKNKFNSGWIGSIGQSFGGLLAPLILFLARRYGYHITFILSLITCVISLFVSSFIRNLHWLLITYSLPYGFANAAIFILGTLICGHYYPFNQHSKHILVMCIISTGFPIGYNIMGYLIFSSIEKNGWQSMKRYIALIELIATCILGPIFTTKYLQNSSSRYRPSVIITDNNNKDNRRSYFSLPIITWMLGIFTTMSAINNFLLHLVCF